jgi:hypothetical protein
MLLLGMSGSFQLERHALLFRPLRIEFSTSTKVSSARLRAARQDENRYKVIIGNVTNNGYDEDVLEEQEWGSKHKSAK